ncbi:hypothetical protein D6C91_05128 [Aureobasidium pullulans]|uniref:N-acetyltransferase domain-containing protein n=1 Tax=Aureobasidium pullulans TaxID=5580 RepID=A0A4S9T5R2_AURPU|nr:hypothetical protein D6C91_05128 [Aureobasidium pullulans]
MTYYRHLVGSYAHMDSLSKTTEATIRLAHADDQFIMASIAARANFDDDLFGKIIHPYREQYPEDMYIYWLRKFRKAWHNPYNLFLVSTVQHNGSELITGMAQWSRRGEHFNEYQALLKECLEPALPVNRAADPEMENLIERSGSYLPDVWTGDRFECWRLNGLAIDPVHQGNRHGTALVRYGLDLAAKENIAASVISAAKKEVAEGFYAKLGFKSIGIRAVDGEGNPLSGIEGGQIMFKDKQ